VIIGCTRTHVKVKTVIIVVFLPYLYLHNKNLYIYLAKIYSLKFSLAPLLGGPASYSVGRGKR